MSPACPLRLARFRNATHGIGACVVCEKDSLNSNSEFFRACVYRRRLRHSIPNQSERASYYRCIDSQLAS